MFVSYGFVRLTRHFNSAGSVFALAGATLGPRAGFFAGFALMASLVYPYTVFPLVVAGWLVLGLAIIFLVPGLATRIGEGLAREEGLRARGRPTPPE